VWQTSKRHRYAQNVAKKVGDQAEKFVQEEGTSDKIAKAFASAAASSVQYIPVGAEVAKYAAKGVQPLLRRAVRHAVNPICQKSACCTPSLYSAAEVEDVESEISYALADSAESTETNIPYVENGSQSKLSCQKKAQKQFQASLPKQVFFNLQDEDALTTKQVSSLVNDFKIRIPKAFQQTLEKQNQFADNFIQALDDAFGSQFQQQAHKQHQLIRSYTKTIVDELREATDGKCNYTKNNQA
jgi:hypothetical protein